MIEKDSRLEVGEYIFVSKYAQTVNGRKETWDEAIDRVMGMHKKYHMPNVAITDKKEFLKLFDSATEMYRQKRILGAQRAFQYGGELMLEKHARLYNCTMTYVDRVEVFEELMYLLLCGCGTGYSVQKKHTEKLPIPAGFNKWEDRKIFVIPDTIEGWAQAAGLLMSSYYSGKPEPIYDYSLIRPKGAHIRGGFKAPGPEPLREALIKISKILKGISGRLLTPFELHYILCILANSVVTGGVRRSAMISLFDADDMEMLTCKTNGWIAEKPELCRSNNSAVILPFTSKEVFNNIFESTKKFGEPGFVFSDNADYVCNPCAEVMTLPKIQDEDGVWHSGWGWCNLTEINGGLVQTVEDFYKACESAAVIGTLQAGYTDFKVLQKWSKLIAQRDSLIGVGITGLCENPDILFNPEVQRKGAEIVKETNRKVAELIGINPAARTTVIKPSGNSSQLLGTLSGITPGHANHYIRHIQAADTEKAVQEWEKVNPNMVEKSLWAPDREKVLAFPITLPATAITKSKLTAVDFLRLVLLTKQNWIECGTDYNHPAQIETPSLRMNVSNTCTVKESEWDEVGEFLWENREQFGGISLLSEFGDLDYPQAPYTEVLDEHELAERYGAGAILSSGLIVDACDVFKDVWEACNAAQGLAPNLLTITDEQVVNYIGKNIKNGYFSAEINGVEITDVNGVISHLRHVVTLRNDWIRRFNAFADKYMNGDKLKTAYCLKHINAYHKWQRICRMQAVNYDEINWQDVELKQAGSEIAMACFGGSCEL